jgi:hypothetical protein
MVTTGNEYCAGQPLAGTAQADRSRLGIRTPDCGRGGADFEPRFQRVEARFGDPPAKHAEWGANGLQRRRSERNPLAIDVGVCLEHHLRANRIRGDGDDVGRRLHGTLKPSVIGPTPQPGTRNAPNIDESSGVDELLNFIDRRYVVAFRLRTLAENPRRGSGGQQHQGRRGRENGERTEPDSRGQVDGSRDS